MSDDADDEVARARAAMVAADDALIAALEDRARAAKALAAIRERGIEVQVTLPRLPDLVARARERARDFPATALPAVLGEVIAACDVLVRPVRVSFSGGEGGLAYIAARRRFGAAAELVGSETIADVVDRVARGDARFGVVPLETSSEGAVTATLEALVHAEARVVAEELVPAEFFLVSRTGSATDVENIYTTPAARTACERTLRAAFPRATLIDVPAVGVGVQIVLEDHGAAVVQPERPIEQSGLRVVKEHVEDRAGVRVRCGVLSTDPVPRTGQDRTLLALALADSPGALHKALKPFADRGVNLTRLESRPTSGSPWKYHFFVELDGHVTDRPVLTAIEELRAASRWVKVLGSYPRPPA